MKRNKKQKKIKRIGIDARFYGPQNKGLGRYCQKTVDYLEKIDGGNKEIEYVIFLRKENFDLYQPKANNFKKVLADFRWYGFGEQFVFPLLLIRHNLDLMHFCHFNVPLFYRKRFIVTIHDLILLHYPTVKNTTLNRYFYYFKLLVYRLVIKSAAQRSEKIIAVSQYTKQDIIKRLKIKKDKIELIYEGVDFHCFVSQNGDEEILKKHGIIKKQYLLYVGNAYPHKNLENLVLAYKKIRKEYPELALVLVGKKDYFYERLGRFINENEVQGVVLAGYVSDEDLDILYKHTRLYVFPSLYEGFGLPPLEALMKGASVVSSNMTCMPEILGRSVCYFDPRSYNTIYLGIKAALNDDRKISAKESAKMVQKFNWELAAQKLLVVYKKVLAVK
ncbi:MAG TPA: glycosyltransferase family 4 protein [Candidatus Moranbacteria bacterium]|nr:glycosyltransferase family 4 protein [Candidatus Moranbacteria bacterium]